MSTCKVAISINRDLLEELDRLVAQKEFESRSQAVQTAVKEKLARLRRDRLARECAKLNPAEEQAMAEEGLSWEASEWPEY